jgi:RNA polymerase sigma-70 factor, ECF subfamily
VHSAAPDATRTDWCQILALYDQLMALSPSAIVALNRAVAVAEVEGAERALRLVEDLALDEYPGFHAVRADLLRRLGRRHAAASSFDAAIRFCTNRREREFLERQRAALG